MSNPDTSKDGFESMIKKLEEIVSKMENGDPHLESLVENYQKGVQLLTSCRCKLTEAEISIQKISEKLANATSK